MTLVEREEFPLDVRHGPAGCVEHVGFVMQGREFGFRAVDDVLTRVGDLDAVMERHDLGAGKQRAHGLAEALHIVDVRVLAGLAETMDL